MSERDVGTAGSWNPGMLRERGMKVRGTIGAGRPQITGVPRVHRHLKRAHGRGTGNTIPLGQTSGMLPLPHSGIRPSAPRAVIHGSTVTDGAK